MYFSIFFLKLRYNVLVKVQDGNIFFVGAKYWYT